MNSCADKPQGKSSSLSLPIYIENIFKGKLMPMIPGGGMITAAEFLFYIIRNTVFGLLICI
jgi:hypothetical protein